MSLLAYPSDASGTARPTPQAQIVVSGAVLVPHGVSHNDFRHGDKALHLDEIVGGFKPGQPLFRNIKESELSETGMPVYYCDWRSLVSAPKDRPSMADVSLVGLAQGDSPAPAMQGARVLQDSTINRSGTYLIPRNRGEFHLYPFEEVYAIPRINGFPDSLFENGPEVVNTFVIVPARVLADKIRAMGTITDADRKAVHAVIKDDGKGGFAIDDAKPLGKEIVSPSRNAFDKYTEIGIQALGDAVGISATKGGIPIKLFPSFPPRFSEGVASMRKNLVVGNDATSLVQCETVDQFKSSRKVIEALLKPLEPWLCDEKDRNVAWDMAPLETIMAYFEAYKKARSHIYSYYLGTMISGAGKNEHVHVDLRIGYKPVFEVI